MTGQDWVTSNPLIRRWYQTPLGRFDTRELAQEAMDRSDFPHDLIEYQQEGEPVQDVIAGLNTYLKEHGLEPDEYGFSLVGEPERWPVKILRLCTFAVEGDSEGYYIHIGVLVTAPGDTFRLQPAQYIDLALAKCWSWNVANRITAAVTVYLHAAAWN